MKIETHNFKFATTNVPNVFKGFVSAGDCISHSCDENDKRGNFHVDLNGTIFLLPSEIPYYSMHIQSASVACTRQL